MPSPIVAYNDAQAANERKICAALLKHIDNGLPDAEKKVWHGHPVWFDDGNPLVGYAVRKSGVQLLFWSGRAFDEADLLPEGDRKSTRLNSSHVEISYAVFCLKKKKKLSITN